MTDLVCVFRRAKYMSTGVIAIGVKRAMCTIWLFTCCSEEVISEIREIETMSRKELTVVKMAFVSEQAIKCRND